MEVEWENGNFGICFFGCVCVCTCMSVGVGGQWEIAE